MTGFYTFAKSAGKALTKKKKFLAVASLASVGSFVTVYPLITGLDNLKEALPSMVIFYIIIMFFGVGGTILIKFLDAGPELLNFYSEIDSWILLLLLILPIVVFLVLIIAKAVKLDLISLPWEEKTENS